MFRARRRARHPIRLTAQCEVDRDRQISSCALFWDDSKSIAKLSRIAEYLDLALIPEQWPSGRDHGPVLGHSKMRSESCDEPGAYVDRTTASPIRSTSRPGPAPPTPHSLCARHRCCCSRLASSACRMLFFGLWLVRGAVPMLPEEI